MSELPLPLLFVAAFGLSFGLFIAIGVAGVLIRDLTAFLTDLFDDS